ncbi:dynein light chain binding protein [Aureococcus anophagefferens]|nr:dynein light chain binding protein [Aureococcus anophagefferens]
MSESLWGELDINALKGGVETAEKQMRKLPGDLKENSKFKAVETVIANFRSLPVIVNLKNEAMKDRHWNKLTEVTGVPIDNIKLNLEDNMLNLQTMSGSRFVGAFAQKVHMLKLFDNVKELIFARNANAGPSAGMVASEKSFNLDPPSPIDGPVEVWMTKVEESMKESLHGITKAGIWWTWEVEDAFRLVGTGDKYALKNLEQKLTGQLNDLVAMVRTSLNKINRKKVNTLLIIDVHSRDICTGFFRYGEYMGLNGRLVITPLTDRCYMTITQALTFKLGGSPAGPAGTGKTETVKDLAKSLALPCFVINCGEGLDYKAMGSIFSGLVQAGAWGCFDEFNRINIEVLSVVSAPAGDESSKAPRSVVSHSFWLVLGRAIVARHGIEAWVRAARSIQNALIYDKPSCDIGMGEIFVKRVAGFATCGFFITMNPGSRGPRSSDNLKALFRPVAMIVPDLQMICEIMLFSEGFEGAKVLARKMTVLYKLSKEQLSKQYHYDFGLRSLKSVLVMAGGLKREYSDLPEDLVLMRVLRDSNMPKYVFEDVEVALELEKGGYKCSDEAVHKEQIDKVIQMYETMIVRHDDDRRPHGRRQGLVLDTLKSAPRRGERARALLGHQPQGPAAPRALRHHGPGHARLDRRRLSRLFRELNEPLPKGKENEMRWIIYDGDVDAVWVENMNSVMDDNRLLTLPNGERLQPHCAMICETFDLQYASPATISRCGMVWVDPKNLGYRPFYERWVRKRCGNGRDIAPDKEEEAGHLEALFDQYVTKCIDACSSLFNAFVKKIATCGLPDGLIADNVFDPESKRWEKWSARRDHLLQEMAPRKPILFVGASGTAKTTIINDYLGSLDDEVSRDSPSASRAPRPQGVQANIEANVDKRTGNFYGPPVGKKLTIFIDDMNMPKVDTYGTQQPITLLLTLISRGFIYDPDLTQKILKDLCYIGAMGPPGGGRNKVDTRFVALFSVFNLPDPAQEVLAASSEGICLAADTFDTSWSIVRLFRNEVQRIFCDRLVSEADLTLVEGKVSELIGEAFPECKDEALENPLVFGDYKHAVRRLTEEAEDPRLYCDMGSLEGTRKIFDAALEHLTRVHRIIRLPRGNALLIGVGGSGKQSLTRLAAYCAGYDIFNISLVRNWRGEFSADLKTYTKLGEKEVVFLFTDAHVAQEGFLEFLNNMLTTGMAAARDGARRYYYVTPKNYLDYIQNYQSQLSLNEKKVDSSVKRLSGGLSKLVGSGQGVDRMSIELTDAKVIVDAKTTDVEALITQIQEKTKIANEQKAEATIKQEQASEQAVVIATEKQKADDALSEAIPALEQAESALANLHKEDNITEKMMKSVRKYFKDPNMTVEKMESMLQGRQGPPRLGRRHQQVATSPERRAPQGQGARDGEGPGEDGRELAELNVMLSSLEKELNEFNAQYTEKNEELTGLQTQARAAARFPFSGAGRLALRLTRGSAGGAHGEAADGGVEAHQRPHGRAQRWTADIESLNKNKVQLVGDCLLAASFLSYSGAFAPAREKGPNFKGAALDSFTHDFRTVMIYETFVKRIADLKVPVTETFQLESFLSSDAIIQGWTAKGLPADEHSIRTAS